MPFEIYQYRLLTKWRDKKAWMRFHWAMDRTNAPTEFAAAQAVNYNLNVETSFLTLFSYTLSEGAGITDTIVRRVYPSGGPASRVHLGGGGLQGQYLSPITETFLSAPITWIGYDGLTCKSVNRLGFIGKGAHQGDDWWPTFRLAVETWITDALTPRITPAGDTFNLTVLKSNGLSVSPQLGYLGQPFSSQITRRWVQ
jgi:hypothetical protein